MKGNFNHIINSAQPVLVDFFAEWCGPCKDQAPILKDLAQELGGKAKIIKIDVDKNPEIANRFQIRGVPTLAIFKNGQTVWKQSGVVDKVNLLSIINQHL
ncbi:thioredoxin [Plebeiibacterium sediminum]|uniref:Thioredoxin n=1 Tax=Plebeiibacterium sediminum TaxID=2992112 RepID=A0AAE3SD94_9BACT|nr:thioredoxin [Plebeiobacterium sediminum]MCW3784875.1 thioredoxin [Plebeiobacterium sediminum]